MYELVSSHCSEAVKYLTLKCWPYYLSRQYSVVFLVAVYTSIAAKDSSAHKQLHDHIALLQGRHPEVFFVVAVMLHLQTHCRGFTIASRWNNTLDRVYANRRDSYRAVCGKALRPSVQQESWQCAPRIHLSWMP